MSNKAKKLKVLKEKDHIQKKRENEYITFSFKYITTNKRYNLKSLDSDKNKKIEAYTKLIEKILEIEKMDWLVFSNYNKEKGLELLPKEQFNFNITEERFKEVKKYTVIRFNGKYRMICIKEASILYLIGFDWNFTAYDHGK